MKFRKFKQLVVTVPETKVMEQKKPTLIEEGTCLIDIDQMIAFMYQIPASERDSQALKDIQKYCDDNNIKLVRMITKYGAHFNNIINPKEGYFEELLNVPQ